MSHSMNQQTSGIQQYQQSRSARSSKKAMNFTTWCLNKKNLLKIMGQTSMVMVSKKLASWQDTADHFTSCTTCSRMKPQTSIQLKHWHFPSLSNSTKWTSSTAQKSMFNLFKKGPKMAYFAQMGMWVFPLVSTCAVLDSSWRPKLCIIRHYISWKNSSTWSIYCHQERLMRIMFMVTKTP